jgi:hypothetical protein
VEQSPSWEANQFASSQEIPRILWNSKVHYRIHKCPPPILILNQLSLVHTPTSHFLQIHFNIILLSAPGSTQWSLSHTSPSKTLYAPLLCHKRATCHTHLILLNFVTRTIFGEQYRSLHYSLCSFPNSPVTSSHLGTNMPHSTLFSNTFNLRSSLNVSDQVSHP